MTILEFSQLIYYDQIQYLKTNLDKTILGWLILKNRSIISIDSISYSLKYGTYLTISGETDTIFDLTNLFQSRGLTYTIKGIKALEVRLEEFIKRLL